MTLDSIFEVSIDVLNILWEEANNHSPPKHISFPSASCLKEIMSDVGQMDEVFVEQEWGTRKQCLLRALRSSTLLKNPEGNIPFSSILVFQLIP